MIVMIIRFIWSILIVSVASMGCLQLEKANVKSEIIGDSYDFDATSMKITLKLTVKVMNVGDTEAKDCTVSVVVKTPDGKVLGSNTVDFGDLPKGGSKVKDTYIVLSLENLSDLFWNALRGQTKLKYETEVSCR
ncbi:hypothetical protein DRP05_04490 [Archaeoglobales archaeon]|nr:MAG: hypothetical protein DRP05_04490 [Archaeoglobales archaeon]